MSGEDQTEQQGQGTDTTGHVTGNQVVVATLDPPLSRSRSATVSGGGRPKLRPRRPNKPQTGHISADSDQGHGLSCESHVTASSDSVPSGESQVTVTAASSSAIVAKEMAEEEDDKSHALRHDQYIMKCQVGPLARSRVHSRGLRCLYRGGN